MHRTAFLALVATSALAGPALAEATGPAAPTVLAYLRSVPAECPGAKAPKPCTLAAAATDVSVHYEDASAPSGRAVAFATAPGRDGRPRSTAVALRLVDGAWQAVGHAAIDGAAPRDPRFRAATITYTASVPRGSDKPGATPSGSAAFALVVTDRTVALLSSGYGG